MKITMSSEMDSTIKSNTTEEDILFVQLKSLFSKAGVEVPNVSRKLFKLIMEPNHERIELLVQMFHRLHPDASFWIDKEETGTRQTKKGPDLEAVLTKCWKVSQWFGLTREERVVRGMAEPVDQYDFWLNLMRSIVDRINADESLEPSLNNPKTLEKLVISNTAAMDVICEADFIGGSDFAVQAFKAGGDVAKKFIGKLDEGINLLNVETPEEHMPLIETSNDYDLQQLQDYLENELDANFNTPEQIQVQTIDSTRSIFDFRNELDEAISNVEVVMNHIRTRNANEP